MMGLKQLDPAQVQALLRSLPRWELHTQTGSISRQFVLQDFVQAFGFMTQIAIAAEKHNHHPEWSNVYNRVNVTWTTHDVHGLSDNDIAMAHFCDRVFAGYAAAPVATLTP